MKTLAFVIGLLWSWSAIADPIAQQALIDPNRQPTNEWASVVWAVDNSGWKIDYLTPDTVAVELDSWAAKPRGNEKRVSYLLKYLPAPTLKPWPGTLRFTFDVAVPRYAARGRAVAYVAANFSIRDTKSGERFWLNIGVFDPRDSRPAIERAHCSPSKSTPAPIVAAPADSNQRFVALHDESAAFSHDTSNLLRTFRLSISDDNMRAIIARLQTMKGWCVKHDRISADPADYEVRQGAIILESRTDKQNNEGVNIRAILRNPSLTVAR
jgi:hypothetical protein